MCLLKFYAKSINVELPVFVLIENYEKSML